MAKRNLRSTIREKRITENEIPSDGLVLAYDDLAYAASLGRTAKFPRGAIAFKWADEMAETTLKEVEWNTTRTGLIYPVAVFEPVELEGTVVSRASVHNISIIKELALGIGDRIRVYKANMIIPQIAENLSRSNTLPIPEACPICGGRTAIEKDADSEVLRCTNAGCPARQLKAYVHFVERDAMNIEGLSEATLEKMIAAGLLHEFADLYRLKREALLALEGFQEKSADKLLAAVEKSRERTLQAVLNALGIPGVGAANARLIALHFDEDPEKLRAAGEEELAAIEGVGPVLASAIHEYMNDAEKAARMDALLSELKLQKSVAGQNAGEGKLKGKTFVITGSLVHFGSRSDLKALIEAGGGKVSGKVSSKTECLINNDAASTSTKNREAGELGVRIVTEDEFLAEYLPEANV